jgi:GWxTD domain-containing protein
MNPRTARLVLFLLVFTETPALLTAQVEVSGNAPDRGDGSLFLEAISFSAANGTNARLDAFVQVSYDALSFVKKDNGYDASYEMTLSVFDSAEALVTEKLWTETIKGVPFDRTASPNAFSITQRSFEVQPGQHSLRVVLRDVESGTSYVLTRKLTIPDYAAQNLSLSGIMLLSRVTYVGDKRSITPNISGNIGTSPDSCLLYLEAYNRQGLDSVRFTMNVTSAKSVAVVSQDTMLRLKSGRNELILRVVHGVLPIGVYNLEVSARGPSVARTDDEHVLATSTRPLYARWFGMPRSITDLDLAIEQVKYIAKDDEISKFKEAKTQDEKMTVFTEFWKKRDPNPSTPRNERMEEYYARVEYANRHFKHYIDGWRTDMGMVYIMFGPPNNVDRHPFEIDSKPYEVWSYYDLNYSFVFVDLTGFGDYRLETPIWEVWNRMRN